MRTPHFAAQAPTAGKIRLFLFALVGGFAAFVNILSRIAFSMVVIYEVAIILAYLCGMTTAYFLNRQFVFAPSGRPMHNEFIRFTLVNIFALTQVWIIGVGLARVMFPAIGFTWHAETIAHIIGVIVPGFTSYLGHKYFSFSR